MKDTMNIIIIYILLTLDQLNKDNSSLQHIPYRCLKITVHAYIMKIKHIALLLRINQSVITIYTTATFKDKMGYFMMKD